MHSRRRVLRVERRRRTVRASPLPVISLRTDGWCRRTRRVQRRLGVLPGDPGTQRPPNRQIAEAGILLDGVDEVLEVGVVEAPELRRPGGRVWTARESELADHAADRCEPVVLFPLYELPHVVEPNPAARPRPLDLHGDPWIGDLVDQAGELLEEDPAAPRVERARVEMGAGHQAQQRGKKELRAIHGPSRIPSPAVLQRTSGTDLLPGAINFPRAPRPPAPGRPPGWRAR